MLEKKIIQTARWLMIGMKDGRYPYSFDNGYDLLSLGTIVFNCIDCTDV